jgi:hypothetical protein
MGFFVMIDQRSKSRVLEPLCARAYASVRPVLLLHLLLADSLFRFATPSQPIVCVKDCPVFYDELCWYVCFGQSPQYNPHRQPSLLHPTL